MSKVGEREVAAAWDANAPTWAAEVRAGHNRTHEFFTSPRFAEFLPDLAGLSVIDLGCGEGRYTRSFARRGARMTGVDISPEMLALARQEEAREPLGIRYELESSAELRSFADHSFDAVVSTMALMDTPDFPAVARQAFRVIRQGGGFFFSVLHPCFMTKGSTWAKDAEGARGGPGRRQLLERAAVPRKMGFRYCACVYDFLFPVPPRGLPQRTLRGGLSPRADSGAAPQRRADRGAPGVQLS